MTMVYVATVHIDGSEINRPVIARIATLVHYGVDTDDIVSRIPDTTTTPARWVRFMAESIRAGRYTL